MIRVLIVDDEYYAVQGLRSGVRWEAIGVDGVFQAYHAAMAQEVLLREEIDILICDIEMPEASGLELMEWVAEQGMQLETVVLTCHSEFAYAQKALQLGGSDYLLKPVVYADLEQVLRKTIGKVEERRRASETSERYRKYAELWNSRKPALLERFWEDLLERRIPPTREAVAAALAGHDVPLESLERVGLVLISLEQWEKPLSEREEEIMEFALRKAAEETLLDLAPGHVIRDRRGHTLAILQLGGTNAGEADIRERCARYLEACNRYFYCKLSCYVAEPVPVTELMGSYLGLLDAEYRNVNRTNEVIGLSEERGREGASAAAAADAMLELADLVEQGKREDAIAALDERLSRLRPEELSVETLTGLYHAILQVVYYALHRKGFSAALLYEEADWPDAAAVTKSVGRLRQWARRTMEAVDRLIASHETGSPVVLKVKQTIAERLNEDLTREQLAAEVFLNPAYLSRLFRKETGMVLTDYILQEKMRKASDLLAKTDRSVSEIADSLGYGNFSYFARLFRKVHGASPQDYRKALKRV